MKDLKRDEIIEKIINSTDINWVKNCKVTKEKLISCWSQNEVQDWKYYGYSAPESVSRIYKKIFKNIEKDSLEPWKRYILRINNYKYCNTCNNLLMLDNFSTNNTTRSKKDNICKTCSNKKCREYYSKNKETINKRQKKYATNNSDLFNEKAAKRRAAKIQRTPKWLSNKDRFFLKEIYSLAKEREKYTNIKWHVDHIIPLQGEFVSGLHVPSNLQVIPAIENIRKKNRYEL